MRSLALQLDWSHRPAGFGPLVSIDDETVGFDTDVQSDSRLARLWSRLPSHWNILAPVGHSGSVRLQLRYAPIVQPPYDDQPTKWGQQIVSAYSMLHTRLLVDDLALFAHPRPHVDLNGNVRLEFVEGPSRRLDTNHDLVSICCDALRQLAPELAATRAVSSAPTLRLLNVALCKPRVEPPTREAWDAWNIFERIAGRFALGEVRAAGEAAIASRPFFCRDALIIAAGELVPELISPSTATYFPWSLVEQRVNQISPREALELIHAVTVRPPDYDELCARLACMVGDFRGVSLQRVVEENPDEIRYLRAYAAQLLDSKSGAIALVHIDRWIALSPGDPAAHAMRGRAMTILGHPWEARIAYDRAAVLGHLPSHFARTSLNREARELQASVGRDSPPKTSVPLHLQYVVLLLSQGRLHEAILWLTERYDDADARGLLASCYEYAGEPTSALRVYESDCNLSGIARCLVALGRRDEAFARVGDDPALLDELREFVGLQAERIPWNRNPR